MLDLPLDICPWGSLCSPSPLARLRRRDQGEARMGREKGRKREGEEEGREKDTIPCLSDYLARPIDATTLLPITLPNATNFLSA